MVLAIADQASTIDRYRHQIADFTHVISNWQTQAELQIVFMSAVIICGALITIFQGSALSWSKSVLRVLAAATTIFTAVNAKVFTADYRLLQQTAIDAGDLIEQLNAVADNLGRPGADVQGLEEQWLRIVTQFRGLQHSVIQGTGAAPISATVKAASAPAWTRGVPADRDSLYFLGEAETPSLSTAEQQALANAIETGVRSLAPGGGPKSATIRRILTNSAARQGNYFAYDPSRRMYRYYILLRISKEIEKIR